MKSISLSCTYFFLMLLVIISCNTASTKEAEPITASPETARETAVDGAWDLVWASYDDTVMTINKPLQFKQFNNGFFSLISWDAGGKLSYAGYGKYELDGNLYKETFLYHTNPGYTGGMDWQEYELKGDTLYMKGFKKVIVGGKEVTGDFPRIEERRVRAK